MTQNMHGNSGVQTGGKGPSTKDPLRPSAELCSRHNPPRALSAPLQAALARGLSILSKLPLMVTLLDPDVGAVFQNELSVG